MNSQVQNPLGIAPVGGLIAKFAIHAIIRSVGGVDMQLLGIGGASNYNLEMGAGYEEKAREVERKYRITSKQYVEGDNGDALSKFFNEKFLSEEK